MDLLAQILESVFKKKKFIYCQKSRNLWPKRWSHVKYQIKTLVFKKKKKYTFVFPLNSLMNITFSYPSLKHQLTRCFLISVFPTKLTSSGVPLTPPKDGRHFLRSREAPPVMGSWWSLAIFFPGKCQHVVLFLIRSFLFVCQRITDASLGKSVHF